MMPLVTAPKGPPGLQVDESGRGDGVARLDDRWADLDDFTNPQVDLAIVAPLRYREIARGMVIIRTRAWVMMVFVS